ncbi:uncharacterized protein LOC100366841 [Saccoglossus kowalevskii]|uniref:Uncharacterized protein LOC100366841 n=1 Tax=Saccoglossus kowalevskii TaxID=10224 RepID=A0ABM0MYR1_SACKO|nr:PREDICTED: uncharacterized protein LOC100366841 [Saccoglossus kowalevskii]
MVNTYASSVVIVSILLMTVSKVTKAIQDPPTPVLNLVLTHISPTGIQVEWNIQNYEHLPSVYIVSIVPDDHGRYPKNMTSESRNVEYLFEDLVPSTYYTITIDALDEDGNIVITNSVTRKTALNACDENPCHNNGKCIVASTCSDYVCECEGCYGGATCQIDMDPCDPDPCSNTGWSEHQCVRLDNSCTEYTCLCRDPIRGCYTGPQCNRRHDPCLPNPCGRGVCVPDALSCNYTCTCLGCYTGDDCDIHFNDPCSQFSPCRNGGTCIASSDTCMDYSCHCPDCFEGEFCQFELDPCQLKPCQNRGTCIPVTNSCTERTCSCKDCYIGESCTIRVGGCTDNPCLHDGICTESGDNCSDYTCQCPWTWLGTNCSWHIALVIVLSQVCVILIMWVIIMTILLFRHRRYDKQIKKSKQRRLPSPDVVRSDMGISIVEVVNGSTTIRNGERDVRSEEDVGDERSAVVDDGDDGCVSDSTEFTHVSVASHDKKHGSLSAVTHEFCRATTWHGLARVSRSTNPLNRLLWTVVVLVACGFFISQGTTMVLRYMSSPVAVRMGEHSRSELTFPAVTICNTNTVRASALAASKYFPFVAIMTNAKYNPYYVPCLTGDFVCNNGIHCIKPFLVCDGSWHCPDTSDEFGCDYGHYQCSSEQFRCASGSGSGICIDGKRQCDVVEDCYAGEDEQNCDYEYEHSAVCTGFYCDDGICHPLSNKCNYITECMDGSDEEDCKYRHCQDWEFHCGNQRCITSDKLCDWKDDCGDQSDEQDCEYRDCNEDEFKCFNGQCIYAWQRCNSYIDCIDLSDEDQCPGLELYCLDRNEECRYWASNGECQQNEVFMKISCPLSCGWCVGEQATVDETGQCPKGYFTCNSGFCIDEIHACNAVPDCHDAEDEFWPNCVYQSSRPEALDVFHGNWSDIFREISTDADVFDEFEYTVYKDPMFDRVRREEPPDWNGFVTFSSTPDFSDLRSILKLKRNELKEYGHKPEDFILQCSYAGVKCSYSDFQWLPNREFGNCYTFNVASNGSEPRSAFNAGAEFGLKLTLFMEQDEYLGIYGQSAGVRVTVHGNNEMPWPEDRGLTAKTGAATSFAVQQKVFSRMPHPYGNCVSNDTYLFNGKIYSSLSCRKMCVQEAMMNYCGCTDTYYKDQVRCNILDTMQEACRQIIHYFYRKGLLECECPPQCFEESYDNTVSMSTWPSESSLGQLLKSLHAINPKAKKITDMNSAQKNLAAISVYFESLSVDMVKESEAYTKDDLMSDVGGLLGLYIGVSVITIVEFIVYLKSLLRLMFTGSPGDNTVTDGTDREAVGDDDDIATSAL